MKPSFRRVVEGGIVDSPMEMPLKWKFWRNLDLITSSSVLESFDLSHSDKGYCMLCITDNRRHTCEIVHHGFFLFRQEVVVTPRGACVNMLLCISFYFILFLVSPFRVIHLLLLLLFSDKNRRLIRWEDDDVTVACQQLGYSSGEAMSMAYYVRGTRPILLDNVECNGDETRIADCSHNE